MPHESTLQDIPAAALAQVVGDFQSEGATSVQAIRQADGRWTVTARFN